MAYYTRLRILAELSDTSDYAKATYAEAEDTSTTPTQYRYRDVFEANTTPGSTYDLTHLLTCEWLLIENLDTANKVTVTYYTGAGAAQVQTIDVPAGKCILLRDLRVVSSEVVDITIMATTAAVKCRISYEGT